MRRRLSSGASFVVATVAIACAVLLAPDCAHASSCAAPAGASPQELAREELSYSDAVFAGEVIDLDKPLIPMGSAAPVEVTFRVSEAWKGAWGETSTVNTASYEESCGYPFKKGERYLVFASEGKFFSRDRALEVGLCGSTKPLAAAETELAALGPGEAPAAEDRLPDTSGARPNTTRALLLASGAALFLAGAAVRTACRSRR